MQFLLPIYSDDELIEALPEGQFDTRMRGCFDKADGLRADGKLLASQQLEPAKTAKTVRVREGRMRVVDGPFAETRELLAGFNLIEAADMDEAVRIASEFPWAQTGSIEVRPVRDMGGGAEAGGGVRGHTVGAATAAMFLAEKASRPWPLPQNSAMAWLP